MKSNNIPMIATISVASGSFVRGYYLPGSDYGGSSLTEVFINSGFLVHYDDYLTFLINP